uniref:VTT domain-containing protein n=1 Tax=Odontella aurita TaxID=265563 RepID=A0A7S4NFE9_9STRA|mmetsp:Transcript_61457/g.181631  ORF Transcript_61457/g.181631 Transcript_61457/m.181631 type:complete len:295 (+) Transcript_61457:103-987(+)
MRNAASRLSFLPLLGLLLNTATISSFCIAAAKLSHTRGLGQRPIYSTWSGFIRKEGFSRNRGAALGQKCVESITLHPQCFTMPVSMLPSHFLGSVSIEPNPAHIASQDFELPIISGVLTNDSLFMGSQGIIFSYLLVSFSDCIPFLPCQPLAIALGAKLGFGAAFPVTVFGQTTAGIIAFTAARRAADNDLVRKAAEGLSPEATEKFEEFRKIGGMGPEDSFVEEGKYSRGERELKILLALIALRLAPFFPFSAGNYLLGGATSVPFRLFLFATLLGSTFSNLISTSIGAGGAE